MSNPQTTFTRLTLCFIIIFFCESCSKDDDAVSETAEYNSPSNVDVVYEKDLQYENNLLKAINDSLSSRDQAPLIRDIRANDVTFDHTLQMIEANALHHDNLSERQAYFITLGYQNVRENVAKGYSTPIDVVAAWLQSENHKSAIESNSTHTGISVLKNESGVYFITQIYLK